MLKLMINFISILVLMIMPKFVQAESIDEARLLLSCAASSMAAYEDDRGLLVRDILKDYNFTIDSMVDEKDKIKAKLLVIKGKSADGHSMNILSICGTEEIKDAKVDLMTKMIPLINTDIKNSAMVHKGFNDYADVILANDSIKKFISDLKKDSNEKLYLTGHSLGGAVAIVMSAKLIEAGFNENQLQVITFGAPAVGDKNFVERYDKKINLTRVTVNGDPIKKALQILGYIHIGNELKYNPVKSVENFPHMMAVYLDCAIRNYYDVRGFELPLNRNISADVDKIYVAPMQVLKDSFSDEDFKYIKISMRDELIRQISSAIFTPGDKIKIVSKIDEFDNDIKSAFESAKKTNCKYVLVQYLQAKKMRDDPMSNHRVSLEEIVYDSNGSLISMQTSSVTTKELTTLEAALFAQENFNSTRFSK